MRGLLGAAEGVPGLLITHSRFKSIAIAISPCNLVTFTDSPSHRLFANFFSQGKGLPQKPGFVLVQASISIKY